MILYSILRTGNATGTASTGMSKSTKKRPDLKKRLETLPKQPGNSTTKDILTLLQTLPLYSV
jgi:hypothetical protein